MKKKIDQLLRKVMMFYVLFVIPTGLILTYFLVFTELHGPTLVYSVTPAAVVLFLTYILYLLKPGWLLRLLNGSPAQEKQSL